MTHYAPRFASACSLFLLLLGAECHKPAPPPAPAPEAPKGIVELTPEGVQNAEVRTAKLTPQTFSPRLVTPAMLNADPQAIARMGARVSGRVAAIHGKLGDPVRKGQPLVEIDAVELHQVATEYLTALARSKEADDALSRQQQLVAERVGALADLRRMEANAETTRATLREADEHLHFLGLADDTIRALRNGSSHGSARSVLRSPIDGRIAALTVSLGQVLTGTEDIVTVSRSDTVQVMLRVYERDLARIAVGVAVEIKVPSYPERVFTGTIAAVGDLIDPTTRTTEARVALANPDGVLKPGMSAVAAIALRSDPSRLWLPVEAIQPSGVDRIAFVRIGERRFERRRVGVGPEQGGMVPVLSGLESNTEVVIHGAFALRGQLERAELED